MIFGVWGDISRFCSAAESAFRPDGDLLLPRQNGPAVEAEPVAATLNSLDMGATRIPAYPDFSVQLSQPFALTATFFCLGKRRQNRLLLGSAPSGFPRLRRRCGGTRPTVRCATPTSRACVARRLRCAQPPSRRLRSASLTSQLVSSGLLVFAHAVFANSVFVHVLSSNLTDAEDRDVREASLRCCEGACAQRRREM